MSLGMNGEELKQHFEKEYIETHAVRYKSDYTRIEHNFIAQGVTQNEARLLALIQFNLNPLHKL